MRPRRFQPSNPSPLAPPDTPPESDAPETPQDESPALPSPLLERLKTFPLFKDAPKLFHTKVAAKLRLVQYHPQEYIIKEGDPALAMYWILKGTLGVTSTDGESVYAELGPGAFFGEIGILFNRPRTATVVARQKVLVGVLTADALNVVLRLYPLIERRIRDEAQERLAMQEKKNKADIPIVKLLALPAPLGGVRKHNHQPLALHPADNVDLTVLIQGFIKSVPIFLNLPAHIIHRLALGVEPTQYKPFEYVFREGDRGADIYFVTHGEVEVVDRAQKVLARLKAGAYFGEMSFLDFLQGKTAQLRLASIRTVASVELIVIRLDLLETVCLQYPEVADAMKHTAAERKNSNEAPPFPYSVLPSRSALPHEDQRVSPAPHFAPLASLLPLLSAQLQLPPVPALLSVVQPRPQPSKAPSVPFFSPDWTFGKEKLLRSVSPVSDDSAPTKSSATSLDSLWRRRSVCEPSSPNLPEGPLNISVPPMNPMVPVRTFQAPLSRRQLFQYMPHNKRVKLANLAGSRRSSVLVSTGSIPDKILLKAFEFLDLPELMRLRVISRRWRQLLYVAPNLLQKLDLTPWNTIIDDQALISITDFVGLRPKYIDISNCFHVTDEGFSYMVNEIGMSGQIHGFKMRSLWEVSAMAIMDLTSPSVGRYLEEVDLSNCRKVKDNVVERLIGWTNDGIGKTLQLPGSEGVVNNDTGSKNLKILNLGYCKHLTDNIMYHISLHANDRLESLDLTRCTTITDAGFQFWTYRTFPNLKKLALKDCTFLSDKAIISLANAAPNLEILDLNFCCALLDIAIEVLCLGCQKLRELDLSFCGSAVSDSSLVAISLHLCNLEKLVVKGCVRVTRAGVDALLSGYSPLNFINISQCRNAHAYPHGVPAQKFQVNPATKSAFISAGPSQKIIEIVI